MNCIVTSAVIFLLFTIKTAFSGSYFDSPYSVPEPKIEVFERGFRIGIPDDDGIHLFAFHGNINYPMNGLEAGMFSRDVLKKRGNEWAFEDKRTVLKKGDIIYFWLFVIRDNLGYRYDDGRYIVNEILPYRPLPTASPPAPPQLTTESEIIPISSTTIPPTPSPPVTIRDPRCDLVLNLTDTVIYLTNDVKMLRETYQILVDIVEKSVETSRTLRFDGFLPPSEDPQSIAQTIIKEKLGVNGIRVVTAMRNDDKSVTFTVETLSDKLRLISVAKEKLKGSKIALIY